MTEFQTTDIEGNQCNYQYIIEEGDILREGEITFKVYEIPKNEYEWFSYKFKKLDDALLKGEVMTVNGNSQFRQKGIPEKIIEIAQEKFKVNIISSPIISEDGDFLVDSSKKAWERLCRTNSSAELDKENGYYILRNK